MTCTPSTSTSWWSRTSLASSTSPGRRTTSRRSSRAERNSHLGVPDAIDGRRGDEGQPPTDPDDQPADRWVGLAVGPARHDVVEPADLLAGLVGTGRPRMPASETMESKTPSDARMRRVRRRRWCGGRSGSRAAPGQETAAGWAWWMRRMRGMRRMRWMRRSAVAWPWSSLLWLVERNRVGSVVPADASRARPGPQRPAPVSVRAHRRGLTDARAAAQPMARSGHAPAALLGGSPLDMAHTSFSVISARAVETELCDPPPYRRPA